MLIKVLRKSDICLFPIALEHEKVRKRESDTTSLDTIIDSFEIIFENEVSIVKTLKRVFKSSTLEASCEDSLPLHESYALIKANLKFLLNNMSREFTRFELKVMEVQIQTCFLPSQVEVFIFGSDDNDHFDGTELDPEAKDRYREVRNARKQYLAIQVLEQPSDEFRLREIVSTYKRDMQSFSTLEKLKRDAYQDKKKLEQKIVKLKKKEKEKEERFKILKYEKAEIDQKIQILEKEKKNLENLLRKHREKETYVK